MCGIYGKLTCGYIIYKTSHNMGKYKIVVAQERETKYESQCWRWKKLFKLCESKEVTWKHMTVVIFFVKKYHSRTKTPLSLNKICDDKTTFRYNFPVSNVKMSIFLYSNVKMSERVCVIGFLKIFFRKRLIS